MSALVAALFLWLVPQADAELGPAGFVFFALCWAGGLLATFLIKQMFMPTLSRHVSEELLVLVQSLWCNLGVVALAALAPHAERLLLLAVPLFGLIYASLHLRRGQVVAIAVATLASFALCTFTLGAWDIIGVGHALIEIAMLAVVLAASVLLAWEVSKRHERLLSRNQALRDALERVQELALKDELTGVHNRRYLMDVLARQKSVADRHGSTFTVCFCDLDHFKRVNDLAGHAVGDTVLREFAQAALSVVRNVDYVARFGGEEFVLLLVDADEQVARQVANRLAAKTKRIKVNGGFTNTPLDLSVSIGLTAYVSGEHVDDVLRRADRALYAAKNEGRDRVIIAA